MVVQDKNKKSLAESNGTGKWLSLSRKHVLEVDKEKKYLSIFGGKLTDCINIGNEISVAINQLGINLPEFKKKWYGEPHYQVKLKNFTDMPSLLAWKSIGQVKV